MKIGVKARREVALISSPLSRQFTSVVTRNAFWELKMADGSQKMEVAVDASADQTTPSKEHGAQKMFSLKKWNAVAMWSWDVECDTCAICRVQVMDACLRCQSDNKQEECVVIWGECNHSFHNCCMSLWVVQNNRCPLCQQEWIVQRIGR